MRALVLACALLSATPIRAAPQAIAHAGQRAQPWPETTVALAASLPVQDGGRVKPLSTFAGFTLLRLSGKRSLTSAAGEALDPVEWLLDLLLYPETAVHHASFLVQDDGAVHALGITLADKQKRDRYSFDELRNGVPKLFELAHEYSAIEERERNSVQQQVVLLASNVHAFLDLAGLRDSATLALFPPAEATAADWRAPGELRASTRTRAPDADDEAFLHGVEALVAQRADHAAFERELGLLHARSTRMASARGEGGDVALEIRYYALQPLTWSLAAFLAAFVAAALLWMWPRNRPLYALTCAGVLAGTLALVAAIVLRCMIRHRPPVSTLYETVLFVTAVGALLGLLLELVGRRRIAVSAAAILGVVGVFVANGYETLDKQDTMPSLVAVLDTNFWLATHVTAITIGYSAGIFAALLGNVYIVTKLLRAKRDDPAFHRSLGRMVYGVLCFAMIFATVGTILGGIWANESWGRFWGWDPKENGALLIVISQIAILHARMHGWLREFGVCIAAAFGGSIVAFSWWGVNLLGVGLHSYGFTSGIHSALWTYYGLQWALVGAGLVAQGLQSRARGARRPASSIGANGESEEKSLAA